ncbi:MAG: hypothetical protein A3G75_15285 [Verrucomicrobia bacterium RIFCSPLOWO2_12_FULL_64_8]|nr:MAG: hypothetical protein A3G75_15285 [Verrucomicrobia bacterium RIFCSPLOWO2_12_FULL_64_8]
MKPSLLLLSFLMLAAGPALAADATKTNPKAVAMPSPGYPAELTDTGKAGVAVMEFVVKADGSVGDIVVKSADHPAFGAAATEVLGQWKFEPGTRNGEPADMKVSLPMKFTPPVEQLINAAFKRKVFLKLTEPALSQKDYGKKLKVKKNAAPEYPRQLRGKAVDAKVEVQFVVAPDGTTVNPKIVGDVRKEFVTPSINAVVKTIYEPPVKDGKPVYVEMSRTLKFSEPLPDIGGNFGGRSGGRQGGEGGGGGDYD